MLDKYGVGQDPLCYPGTTVLRNRLDLTDDQALHDAERTLSEIAAGSIDFALPPYDLTYLQRIHRTLFEDVYEWAGELRTVDISKGGYTLLQRHPNRTGGHEALQTVGGGQLV